MKDIHPTWKLSVSHGFTWHSVLDLFLAFFVFPPPNFVQMEPRLTKLTRSRLPFVSQKFSYVEAPIGPFE